MLDWIVFISALIILVGGGWLIVMGVFWILDHEEVRNWIVTILISSVITTICYFLFFRNMHIVLSVILSIVVLGFSIALLYAMITDESSSYNPGPFDDCDWDFPDES